MAAINLPDYNLTFVHIPKSAGSSIVRWLTTNFPNHMIEPNHPSLATIKEFWAVKDTFAVVRNPWARIVSGYFYLKQYGFYWNDNKVKTVDDFPSWDQFIENFDYTIHGWNNLTTNQIEWIPTGVDYLLKAESLDKDFVVIQDLLKCYEPVPYINTSTHNDYRTYFNSSQRDKIAKIFARDIDTYKYTF
jgi:Sulfotransferase family